jgi:ABC-type transporter MlaC component
MKQKSIAITTAVLAATMLTAVFATAQLAQIVYADDSSETEINIKEKKEVDINGDGNTVLQCSKNNFDSEIDANTIAQCSDLPEE